MKIYKNSKDGSITIVWTSKERPVPVTLVHDRGPGKLTSMFGSPIERYLYHVAEYNGDSGHSTMTNRPLVDKSDKQYKLVLKHTTVKKEKEKEDE